MSIVAIPTGLKGQRLRLYRGALVSEYGTVITRFIPGIAGYIADLWNERIGQAESGKA